MGFLRLHVPATAALLRDKCVGPCMATTKHRVGESSSTRGFTASCPVCSFIHPSFLPSIHSNSASITIYCMQ
ncbi:hypothetical protein Pmani_009286 [Petrolisthes manimaculis]|uniref:Uncharacterized protein n=1 Tax=Petrolisthes manimaculis TaxID=1843537 RepID=A0AAE1Q572_9EUCA|nr:hypothetical protein Pmani_009286 [Petrolisthes manimaculis]